MDIIITCAKCNKPVDKMTTEYNFNNDTRTYTVICHGEHESTTIAAIDMLDSHFTGGVAFKKPRFSANRPGGLLG